MPGPGHEALETSLKFLAMAYGVGSQSTASPIDLFTDSMRSRDLL